MTHTYAALVISTSVFAGVCVCVAASLIDNPETILPGCKDCSLWKVLAAIQAVLTSLNVQSTLKIAQGCKKSQFAGVSQRVIMCMLSKFTTYCVV